MPWCPHCRVEYRQGFTHCADCGAMLTDTLGPQPVDICRPAQPVPLTHNATTFEADSMIALLRGFEIPCFSQPNSGAEKLYTGISLAGETVFVEQSQLMQAKEIIRGYQKGGAKLDADDVSALTEKAPPDESPEESAALLPSWVIQLLVVLLALPFLASLLLPRLFRP